MRRRIHILNVLATVIVGVVLSVGSTLRRRRREAGRHRLTADSVRSRALLGTVGSGTVAEGIPRRDAGRSPLRAAPEPEKPAAPPKVKNLFKGAAKSAKPDVAERLEEEPPVVPAAPRASCAAETGRAAAGRDAGSH